MSATGTPTMGQEFNSLVSELQELGKRRPVTGDDAVRAKHVMRRLRQMGFTAEEISILSGGRWEVSIIKQKTRNEDKPDASFRHEAIEYLRKMASMGLTPKQVKSEISTRISLLGNNISISEIARFVNECKQSGISTKSLADMQNLLTHLGDDAPLPLEALKEILLYRSQLGTLGIDVPMLAKVMDAAKKYGKNDNPALLLDAMAMYAELSALQEVLGEAKNEKDSLSLEVDRLHSEIARLKSEVELLKGPLRAFNEVLKPSGYDENTLSEISQAARRYHEQGGVKAVLEAVKKHVNLSEIQEQLEETEQSRDKVAGELKQIEANKAHLMSVINVCDLLMFKLGFSEPAIRELVNLAKTFGKGAPLEVFNAVLQYGEIRNLEEKIASLSVEKSSREASISELQNRLDSLNNEAKMVSNLVQSAIGPLKDEYCRGASHLASVYSEELKMLQQESVRQAEKLAAEKMFSEELSTARLIAGMYRYPHELLEVPLDMAVFLLDVVIRFCNAKGVNPKITLVNLLGNEYPMHTSATIPTSHLLRQAHRLLNTIER